MAKLKGALNLNVESVLQQSTLLTILIDLVNTKIITLMAATSTTPISTLANAVLSALSSSRRVRSCSARCVKFEDEDDSFDDNVRVQVFAAQLRCMNFKKYVFKMDPHADSLMTTIATISFRGVH